MFCPCLVRRPVPHHPGCVQPWRGYVVGEQAHGLDHCLGKVVGSFCHVIRQVYLELVVPAIVGSMDQHAQEVALATYLLGFLDIRAIRGIDILGGFHPLCDKLRCHQSLFAILRTSLRMLNYTNQGLEVLHILCVGHIMALVVHRHLMLSLLECPRALLVVVEAAAAPLFNY